MGVLEAALTSDKRRTVNNDVYATLGERWYHAADDPIALLRAQARLHVPWVADRLRLEFGERACRLLDVGCGGGFMANAFAKLGHSVVGVDLAAAPLEVAARYDHTGRARYVCCDAGALPFPDASFEAACAMDMLEHVEDKEAVVAEVARVLTPGGLFFFHTFNRTALSFLVVIKGVELFLLNVPRDLHVLRLFITPAELRTACEAHALTVRQIHGCSPAPSRALIRMLVTGVVPEDLMFRFTRSAWTGYSGFAAKDQLSGQASSVTRKSQ
jgi:2-polyprenyl-6-hydroxyphenyl methylase/3-demethylubiquinone-9 3-methyltransferase